MADTPQAGSGWRTAIDLFEKPWVPDPLSRLAIRTLVARSSRALRGTDPAETAAFAREMASFPIALHPEAANAQHYEVPAAFFERVLGPQRKYSCCHYAHPDTALAEAEEEALAQTARNARLADGQSILELGCGWGSLSLWMAARYPAAKIVAVSNSRTQKASIDKRAQVFGLSNLTVVTADANTFVPDGQFDRVVSIEMFEHMSNWSQLLSRIRGWLAPDGRLFIHVFTHRAAPYRFDHTDPSDWIGQHFFTGGIMPSETLIAQFPRIFTLDGTWRWSGTHYARTAEDWLRNFDRNSDYILQLFGQCYGSDAALWHRRWRLFFLATAGLFGYAGGGEWGVNHYLLRPVRDEGYAPNQRETVGASA